MSASIHRVWTARSQCKVAGVGKVPESTKYKRLPWVCSVISTTPYSLNFDSRAPHTTSHLHNVVEHMPLLIHPRLLLDAPNKDKRHHRIFLTHKRTHLPTLYSAQSTQHNQHTHERCGYARRVLLKCGECTANGDPPSTMLEAE